MTARLVLSRAETKRLIGAAREISTPVLDRLIELLAGRARGDYQTKDQR